jgi:hypothetical protein
MEINTKSNISTAIARTVSVIFHPLFISLYGMLVVFTAPTLFWYIPIKAKEILFFIFLVNNVLIPVSLIPFFRYRNLISSWVIENRTERTLPLMTVSLLYAVTSFILSRLQIPLFFKAYAYSLTMLSIVLLILNRWWKISLHSAGAGALISVVLILSVRMSVSLPVYLCGTVLIAGLILSSRLKRNYHNPSEVYAGFLAGFIISAGLMLLFQ